MTFSQSVRTCLRDKYVTFSGRAPRSEYWWFYLFAMLIWIVPTLVIMALFGSFIDPMSGNNQAGGAFSGVAIVFGIIFVVLFLGLLLPWISVTVRRFHDRGLSGWWVLAAILVGMVPYVGWLASIASLVITILKGNDGPNKFGPDPLKPGNADIFA